MKKIKIILVASLIGVTSLLTGCHDDNARHNGVTAREQACLDNGGTWDDCTYEGRQHAERMAQIQNGDVEAVARQQPYRENYNYNQMDYPPAEPQHTYINYYGNPLYGYWSGGIYHFNDPYSMYAIQTNSYLLSAGLSGLAAYVGTKAALRSTWNNDHPNGYTQQKATPKQYIGKGGKPISKKEAMRRRAQSRRDKKAHKAKVRKQKITQAKRNTKAAALKAKRKATQKAKNLKQKYKYSTSKNKNNFNNFGKSNKSKYNSSASKHISSSKSYSSSSHSSYKPRKKYSGTTSSWKSKRSHKHKY